MAMKKRRGARSAGRALRRTPARLVRLMGGPWDGQRISLSFDGPGTLRFSLGGWVGRYTDNGVWENG